QAPLFHGNRKTCPVSRRSNPPTRNESTKSTIEGREVSRRLHLRALAQEPPLGQVRRGRVRHDAGGATGRRGGAGVGRAAHLTAAGAHWDVAQRAPGRPVAVAGPAEVPRLVHVVVVEVAELGLLALAPRARQRHGRRCLPGRRGLVLRLLLLLGLCVFLEDHCAEQLDTCCFVHFAHHIR
ncbi:unnamed protein product, partial [Musa acuminata subsp. malaccensis]